MQSWQQLGRCIFRCQSAWALVGWLSVLVALFAFVDVPVARYFAAHQSWAGPMGAFFEPFGDSFYPIVGGAAMAALMAIVALSFAQGRARRLLDSLGQVFWLLSLTSLWSGLCVMVLKRLIGRPRPEKLFELGAVDWQPLHFEHLHVSMPSGHSATAFAYAFVLSSLFPRFRPAIIALVCLVPLGRVMGGDHYPSDLLVGSALGWFLARGVARQFVGPSRILTLDTNQDFAPSGIWQSHHASLRRWLRS